MVSATTPGQPGGLSPTAAAATAPSAVRPSRQTARGRTPDAREHARRLRDTGSPVAARLAHSPVSSTVNTSLVARDNLPQRQSKRRLTRRTNGFSKDLTWLEKQLWLSLAYDHCVLPHKSVRERLPTPEPTRGAGSLRTWRPVTPAMAAGLTDPVWTTGELLAYRVPVEFLDQLRTIEHLFPKM
jgi:hypothetical protein